MLTRKLLALVFPEGLLLLAAVALVHWGSASPSAAPFVRLYPIVVLAAGALLGWRFQRGRLLLALLAIALADRAMIWLAPPESGAPHAGPVTVRAVAMLLPATLAVLAFLDERGVLSTAGLRRLAILGAEAGVVLVLAVLELLYPAGVARALDAALVPPPLLAWMPIGQPAAIIALLAVAALVGRTLWRPDAEARGFLWAAVGCVIALCAGPASGRATSYFASAAMVLVVATVERAYAMAYHDELTGLPARRALNEALARSAGMYTVAMVDVDHFKKFNDTHGHDVGDQVLRMVAARLGAVSGGGKAFRYGGEEFAVLFPGKTAKDSAPHLERLRASVAESAFALRGKDRPKQKPESGRGRGAKSGKVAVTVSIGAAQARGTAVPDEIVKAADRALYRAKEGGRNRVEM